MNVFSALAATWSALTTTTSTTRKAEEAAAASVAPSRSSAGEVLGNTLGKDDFLRLLVTQLTYQDPINPISDQEFIAQLAQFSALEQMYNVSQQVKRLADIQLLTGGMGQAASLLGRTVVVFDAQKGETLEGVVEAVRMEEGMPMLVIGERRFSLYDVVEVRGGA